MPTDERTTFIRRSIVFLFCLVVVAAFIELFTDERGTFLISPATTHVPFDSTTSGNTSQKRRLLVLHVGPHKTGTTSIQASIEANVALRNDSFAYLGKFENGDKSRQIRFRIRLRAFRDNSSMKFFRVLRQRLEEIPKQHNAICSAEELTLMLNARDRDGTHFFSLLKEQLNDWEVRVVVGYRRHFEWVVSNYNQIHKNKMYAESFVDWYKSPDGFISKFENDCRNAHRELQKHFESVSILNFHTDFLTSLYCDDVLPNTTHACEWYTQQIQSNHLSVEHANPSVSLWPIAMTMQAKWLGFRVKEEDIVEFATRINYTFPLTCLSPQEQQLLLTKSLEYEEEMLPTFFASPMGQVQLQKDFEKSVAEHKFCSVDFARVFQDKAWIRFFGRE